MAGPTKLPPGATLVSDGAPSNSSIALPPGATLVSGGSSPGQQSSPPAEPSFRDKIDSYLNNTSDDGMVARALKGAGRALVGIPETVADVTKAPQTTAEKVVDMVPGGLAMKRALWDPAVDQAQKAANNWKRGQISEAMGHGAAAVLPMVGPWAANMGERAGQGDFAGTGAELATGLLVPKIAGKIVGKVARGVDTASAPLADTMGSPRGPTPAEAATPADIKGYADANNIPMNAAQVTEHNLPRNIQSAGERATIGGTAVRKQIKSSQAAIAQHTSDLMDQMAPGQNIQTAGDAGEALRGTIQKALEDEQTQSRQLYSQVDNQAKGVGVDLRPVKQLAAQVLQDNSFVRDKAAAVAPKRGLAVLKMANDLPDNASFSDTQALRSALLDESKHPDNVISQQAQGWIKHLTGAVDDQMMTGATGNAKLEPAFRAANDHWTGLQEDFNNPRSPLFQALQEPDPNKIPQKFSAKGQIGGSPFNAEVLDKYGIDKGPLKRMVLQDMLNQDFKIRGKTLAGYSDDFLKSLYTPAELESVYKTGAIARSVGMNTNPSGTAAVEGAMQDVQKPIRSAIPKTWSANRTVSPSFNDRLMKSTPGPVAGTIADMMRGAQPAVAASGAIGGSAQAPKRGRLAQQMGR